MRIELHKDKNIGKVLFIVEGSRTEPYIMTKLFTSILDYQLETKLREKGYKQYNSKVNPDSKIFGTCSSALSWRSITIVSFTSGICVVC